MGAKQLAAVIAFVVGLVVFVAPSQGVDAAPQQSALMARATPTPQPRSISVFGYKFRPNVLRVKPGTVVTWINGDRDDHNITGIIYRDTFGNTWNICPERACPPPPDGVIAPPTPPSNPDVPEIDSEADIQDPVEGCGLCARPTPPRPTPRPSGYSYSYTFTEPGSYAVKCTIHPRMAMTIVVR